VCEQGGTGCLYSCPYGQMMQSNSADKLLGLICTDQNNGECCDKTFGCPEVHCKCSEQTLITANCTTKEYCIGQYWNCNAGSYIVIEY